MHVPSAVIVGLILGLDHLFVPAFEHTSCCGLHKQIVQVLSVMSEANMMQLSAQEPALFTEDLCSS